MRSGRGVRGRFIKAYAREVGVDCAEALRRYRAAQPKSLLLKCADPRRERAADADAWTALRVALVVFLILIVATLTLSLLCVTPPPAAGCPSRY